MLRNLTVKQTWNIFLRKLRPFLFVISESIAMHRLRIINQDSRFIAKIAKVENHWKIGHGMQLFAMLSLMQI